MNRLYKDESFILFSCILIIIVVCGIYYITKTMNNYYKKYKTYNQSNENFGITSDNKRGKMMKLFRKDDAILNPNENSYDVENYDPDGTYGQDPD